MLWRVLVLARCPRQPHFACLPRELHALVFGSARCPRWGPLSLSFVADLHATRCCSAAAALHRRAALITRHTHAPFPPITIHSPPPCAPAPLTVPVLLFHDCTALGAASKLLAAALLRARRAPVHPARPAAPDTGPAPPIRGVRSTLAPIIRTAGRRQHGGRHAPRARAPADRDGCRGRQPCARPAAHRTLPGTPSTARRTLGGSNGLPEEDLATGYPHGLRIARPPKDGKISPTGSIFRQESIPRPPSPPGSKARRAGRGRLQAKFPS